MPSHFIFTLHTTDCRTQDVSYPHINVADDTALIGLIYDNGDTNYQHHLESFEDYCETNYLQLNISKTKEQLIDFRFTNHQTKHGMNK